MMDFMVQGSPTPRNYERNIPGSARNRPGSGRPPSAKPTHNRNPITGEETPVRTQSRPGSRPDGVPSLDLKAFHYEDKVMSKPNEPVDIELYTPGSNSTVSWGTPCSSARVNSYRTGSQSKMQSSKPSTGKSTRPDSVPGLYFGYTDDHRSKQMTPKQKEPSAWDKAPCPDDLPAPSQRHQEMYKQYQDEMKQSYRKNAGSKYVSQEDVDTEVSAYKLSHPKKTLGEIRREVQKEYSDEGYDEDDVVDKDWAKKQSHSSTQLLRKMDAEDLLEFNKQQKMIETVMIDQLSRAVISDPEQNVRTPSSYDTRRVRGSNRFLHESKVRTSATATENLLSKRVRFGARILTRNGHDAMRELTGFFFDVDKTLTIYEFRQFGSSAKALPFVSRGKYKHLHGPLRDKPYDLTDIYSGSNLIISTEGQHSLPDTLKKLDEIYFRVIDVDEEEKQKFLLQDVRQSARAEIYTKLHMQNKEVHQNKITLLSIQEEVQKQLKKRGIKTYTGLGRYYRNIDETGTGILYRFELEKGLFTYHIELPPDLLDASFEALDTEETGQLDYSLYMKNVIGEMNEYRKSLVRKAFKKIDSKKVGCVTLSDIRKYFNANFKQPSQAACSGKTALQAFLDAVTTSSRQDTVMYADFEEYYEGLSLCIEDDEHFANILRNTWNI